MNINSLNKEYINEKRYRALSASRRKLYTEPGAAWVQGWDAAIRFVKQVDAAYCTCTHCGKLITSDNDFLVDAEGYPFCAKCYDKLFNNDASNRK